MRAGLKTVKDLMSANKQVAENTKDALLTGALTAGLLGGAAGTASAHYKTKKLINKLKKEALGGLGAIPGSVVGGLGGYGLTSLMTKNKLLQALGALGGSVAGGLGGMFLAGKYASERKMSNMNSKFAKNINSDKQKNDVYAAAYKALYDQYYKGLNTNVPSYEDLDSQITNYLKTNKVPNDVLMQALINDVKGSSKGITDKSELRKNLIRTAYKGLRSGVNTKNNILSGVVGLLGAGLGGGLGYMLGKNNKVPMTIGGGVLGGSLAGYIAKKSLGTPETALRDKFIRDNIKELGKKMSQYDKEVRDVLASL